MSLFYLNQTSTMPIPEEDEDRIHPPISFTLSNNDSSFSYPILFHTLHDHDQGSRDHHLLLLQQQQQQQQQQQEVTQQFLISDLSNCPATISTDDSTDHLKLSLCNNQYLKGSEDDHQVQVPAGKWMSSKMRIMKKMMKSDHSIEVSSSTRRNNQVILAQDQTQPSQVILSSSNENSPLPSGIVRICSDCHTTKTPLWRSGPCGPKSLCNACGIRQRKARRAMAAAVAAAADGEGLVPEAANAPLAKARKEKKVDVDRTVPFKKRCKFISAGSNTTTRKKLRFEDHISLSLSTSSSFHHQVFPQDERDAAILLMALSCGPAIRI